jgi:hypothetical protein
VTERKPAPADLPGWPRRLSLKLAAAYVGVGPAKFLLDVKDEKYPKPEKDGRLKLWDLRALDAVLDSRNGQGAELEPRNDLIARAKEFFSAKGSAAVHS